MFFVSFLKFYTYLKCTCPTITCVKHTPTSPQTLMQTCKHIDTNKATNTTKGQNQQTPPQQHKDKTNPHHHKDKTNPHHHKDKTNPHHHKDKTNQQKQQDYLWRGCPRGCWWTGQRSQWHLSGKSSESSSPPGSTIPLPLAGTQRSQWHLSGINSCVCELM